MKGIHFRYLLCTFHGSFLGRNSEGFYLKTKPKDAVIYDEDVLIFKTFEEAEDFIFLNNLLELDVTLRPFLL